MYMTGVVCVHDWGCVYMTGGVCVRLGVCVYMTGGVCVHDWGWCVIDLA